MHVSEILGRGTGRDRTFAKYYGDGGHKTDK